LPSQFSFAGEKRLIIKGMGRGDGSMPFFYFAECRFDSRIALVTNFRSNSLTARGRLVGAHGTRPKDNDDSGQAGMTDYRVLHDHIV
jgi:hypothetical protein